MFTKVIAVLLLVLIVLSGCTPKITQPPPETSPTQSPKSGTQTPVIPSPEAKNNIGKRVTVELVVADTRYASGSRGQPTFLNDKPYPNHNFTVVIWGRDRSKFGTPERSFKGKLIRASGLVESFQGKPQIVANDPSQIQVMD
ncbi:MAG: nucleic acid binding OB-fold tRNA/helicase-type [Dehalococcoidia bacterium]|nr:nucleic acid binding OB-fold tRNA/helicase-type [Dehalococcoidia bacterium]